MSCCYSVVMVFTIKRGCEDNLKDALREFIRVNSYEGVNFNLSKFYNEKHLSMRKLIDMIEIVFGGFEDQTVVRRKDTIYLDADYNSCYSWETVIQDAFESMARYLTDDSNLALWIDNESYEVHIKDGCTVYDD